MKYRFVRQAPIEVDPHNPGIVYHGAQYVMRTTDGGIHRTKFSPDVTANEPGEKQMAAGEPITRDVSLIILTDGANSIPADHPMHVVREDPRR